MLGALLIFLSDVFSQDTLTYKFVFLIADSVYSSFIYEPYIEGDTVLVIELFKEELCYFKKEGGQYFMKHDSDWIVFFDKNKDSCGSWKFGDLDYVAQWEKTIALDGTDTIYKLYFSPIQFVIYDSVNPFYFTYSSGVIGLWGGDGTFYIREDKKYLNNVLNRYVETTPYTTGQ